MCTHSLSLYQHDALWLHSNVLVTFAPRHNRRAVVTEVKGKVADKSLSSNSVVGTSRLRKTSAARPPQWPRSLR